MGIIRTKIELRNPRAPELHPIEVIALVDTGALMLCLPEHVAAQLQLDELQKREVTTADGRRQTVPYVGPVRATFENRDSFCGALVMGDEVILGSIPMEDMDLVINPARQKVTVNPESPNMPMALAKGFQTAHVSHP